jgi:hypothetical protein
MDSELKITVLENHGLIGLVNSLFDKAFADLPLVPGFFIHGYFFCRAGAGIDTPSGDSLHRVFRSSGSFSGHGIQSADSHTDPSYIICILYIGKSYGELNTENPYDKNPIFR